MLQAEEVDEDYFTPVSSSSLASIFESNTESNENTGNNSLKYTPPKVPLLGEVSNSNDTKTTDCLLACALVGYEWVKNTYTARGKLGFAIIKHLKDDNIGIILYESNKTTLSSTSISSNLNIFVKGSTFISYFDDLQKYWSIYGSEKDIKRILDTLIMLGVNVKQLQENDIYPPQLNTSCHSISLEKCQKKILECDADSLVNQKTNMSILNRMANMGQSMLPLHAIISDKKSDSSDTNDGIIHATSNQHKASKAILKKNTAPDRFYSESQSSESIQKEILSTSDQSLENLNLYTLVNGRLVPVTQSRTQNIPSHDINIFISEQRINNSELRININRLTDKIDNIASKFTNLPSDSNYGFQIEILQKLLSEYEGKIKTYETLINSKGANICISESHDIKFAKSKIEELEKMNQNKDEEIIKLKQNENMLKEKQNNTDDINELLQTISQLKLQLSFKNTFDASESNNEFKVKIKHIMNDTFHCISQQFNNNENYTGEKVKNIVGTVIKKVTVEYLEDT